MEPTGSRPHGAQLGGLGPSTGCFYPSQLVGVGVAPVLSSGVQGDEGAKLGMRRRRRLLNPMSVYSFMLTLCTFTNHESGATFRKHKGIRRGSAQPPGPPPGRQPPCQCVLPGRGPPFLPCLPLLLPSFFPAQRGGKAAHLLSSVCTHRHGAAVMSCQEEWLQSIPQRD